MSSSHNDSTALDYCVNKAIPDGSNLYYATVFESQKNRTIIITFHAFLYELSEIIQECSDPGVARIKLKWWQEEIERFFNQQARHPVTCQMQECIDINQDLKSTFNSVIEFFDHFIFIEQTDNLDTVLELYQSTTGQIWYQCGKELNNDKESLDIMREMGALIHFLACLQHPNTYINEARCIIPCSYISHTDLINLLHESASKHIDQKEVFSPLLIELKDRLDQTFKRLKIKDGKKMKHALILNRFALKTCDEILTDGCNLLNKNISLTPLRKLWIAWLTNTFS
ncbi:MAG: squalene/phytoene synthase family protein [Proteobacteria bacterium]|nr:hypothetical protein [Pseudomonadota bacterium]NOG59030.1 squalene/phytoene synthase family protein [Pseudomonadota bacterium]